MWKKNSHPADEQDLDNFTEILREIIDLFEECDESKVEALKHITLLTHFTHINTLHIYIKTLLTYYTFNTY